MINPIAHVGYVAVGFVEQLGRLAVFAKDIVASAVTPPIRIGAFLRELYKVGVLSLIIICVCGVAVGMVLGLQGYHTLVRFGAAQKLGALVSMSLFRELGPVLTALLVTGRAGSATTAEIGTMNATEQLDGLRMLSVNPIHYVVTPRALAMAFVMPLLTAIFILCGLYGGYVVGVRLMGGDSGLYIASVKDSVTLGNEMACCLIKSAVFGVLLGLIATYRGYTSRPNAAGVSAATTSTVVVASVCILLFDYVVTALWGI